MTYQRAVRVAEEIQKEVSGIIQKELKDPRIGFVTITGVDVTSDLKLAKIFVSVLGDEKAREETFLGLEKAKGFIRREVGHRIRLKNVPEIMFKFDESVEHGARISQLLHKIHENETPENKE